MDDKMEIVKEINKKYLQEQLEEALDILYNLEDKTNYKNSQISQAINRLQKVNFNNYKL